MLQLHVDESNLKRNPMDGNVLHALSAVHDRGAVGLAQFHAHRAEIGTVYEEYNGKVSLAW